MEHSSNQAEVLSLAQSSSSDALAISPNAMAALGYFCGVAAIVALVVKPYNTLKETRFHAIQALFFQGAWIVGYMGILMLMGILGGIFSLVFGALKMYALAGIVLAISPVLTGLFTLLMFVAWMVLIAQSAMGKSVKLPVLGKIASRM